MDNNLNLIPANSKKSMLILGIFNPTDLIIFITGIAITFLLLLILGANTLKNAIIILIPALIASFLIVPIPNQHNIRTFIINVYNFYSKSREYHWRGWCMKNGEDK